MKSGIFLVMELSKNLQQPIGNSVNRKRREPSEYYESPSKYSSEDMIFKQSQFYSPISVSEDGSAKDIRSIDGDLLSRPSLTLREMTSVLKDVVHNVDCLSTNNSTNIQSLFAGFRDECLKMNNSLIGTVSDKFQEFTLTLKSENQAILEAIAANKQNIDDLNNRITKLESSSGSQDDSVLFEINAKIDSINSKIAELEKTPTTSGNGFSAELDGMRKELDSLALKYDASERFIRKTNLIISNLIIEDVSKTDMKAVVLKMASVLKVQLAPEDLVSCNILNKRSPTNYIDLLVNFRDINTKRNLMKAYFEKKNLSNSHVDLSTVNQRIYFNDNLTSMNANIYKAAKNLFRQVNNKELKYIKSIFIFKGQIHLRVNESRTILVDSLLKLQEAYSTLSTTPSNPPE